MDLVLNNLLRLICHKSQTTNQYIKNYSIIEQVNQFSLKFFLLRSKKNWRKLQKLYQIQLIWTKFFLDVTVIGVNVPMCFYKINTQISKPSDLFLT